MKLIAADRFAKYRMIVFDILFRIQTVKVRNNEPKAKSTCGI